MTQWFERVALGLLPESYRARFGDDLRRDWRRLRDEARRTGGRRGEYRYVIREARAFLRLVRETRMAGRPSLSLWSSTRVDARAAVRRLTHQPGRALAAVVMLAAAFTATLVSFAVTDAVLWRDLPFREPDRLVAVWERTGSVEGGEAARMTGFRFVDWSAHASSLEGLAAFGAAGFQVESGDGVATVRGVRVSGHFFDTLGIQPAAGRLLTRADQQPGAPRVVVLSHAYWVTHFGGRVSAVGQTLRLSGQPYTIVGVLPEVWLPSWPVNPATIQLDSEHRQLWIPIAPDSTLARNGGSHLFGAIGRLAQGHTPETARQQLEALASPDQPDPHGGVVRPLRTQMVQQTRGPLLLLLGAACCVMLVACLNLAAIDLAAFESRLAEFRVRAALGAGTVALTRQLVLETVPIVMLASVLSLVASHAVLGIASTQLDNRVPLLTAPQINGVAMAGLVVLSIIAVLVMTTWPVVRVRALSRVSDHSDTRIAASNPRVFRVLVTGQLTGAVALVLVSTVLVRTFLSIGARDPGFDPAGVQVLEISLPRDRYRTPAAIVAVERRIQERLDGAAGVRAAATSYDHPFEANWSDIATVLGRPGDDTGDARAQVQLRIVGPSYVEAMRARLVEGQGLDPLAQPDDDGQVLVNEAFVRREGAGIGRQVRLSSPSGTWGPLVPASFTIVGVLQDERFKGLELESEPAVYVSTRQFPQTDLSLLVRSGGDGFSAAHLRALVQAVEPGTSFGPVRPLIALEAQQRAPRTLMTALVGGFASGALLLAATGLYGMLMLLVTARRREIGIRMALGATPRAITQRVVVDATTPVYLGCLLGIGVAMAGERLVRSVLVDVGATSPSSIVLVVLVMALTGAVATWMPARRAGRTRPTDLLRS